MQSPKHMDTFSCLNISISLAYQFLQALSLRIIKVLSEHLQGTATGSQPQLASVTSLAPKSRGVAEVRVVLGAACCSLAQGDFPTTRAESDPATCTY